MIEDLKKNCTFDQIQKRQKLNFSAQPIDGKHRFILGHGFHDFQDLTVPRSADDLPASVRRYLAIERARRGMLLPYVKKCYIPVTHLIEQSSEWDFHSQLLPGQVPDRSEYQRDLDISSLSRFKGERAYI